MPDDMPEEPPFIDPIGGGGSGVGLVLKSRNGIVLGRTVGGSAMIARADDPGSCACCSSLRRFIPCDAQQDDMGCAAPGSPPFPALLVNCSSVTCATTGYSPCDTTNVMFILVQGWCYRLDPNQTIKGDETTVADTEVQCLGTDITCLSPQCATAPYIVGRPCPCGTDCWVPPFRVLICKSLLDTYLASKGTTCAVVQFTPPGDPDGQHRACIRFEAGGETVVRLDFLPTDVVFSNLTNSTDRLSCCRCCNSLNTSCTKYTCVDRRTLATMHNRSCSCADNACLNSGETDIDLRCCCKHPSSYTGLLTSTEQYSALVGCIGNPNLQIRLVYKRDCSAVPVEITPGVWRFVGSCTTYQWNNPDACSPPDITTTPYQSGATISCGGIYVPEDTFTLSPCGASGSIENGSTVTQTEGLSCSSYYHTIDFQGSNANPNDGSPATYFASGSFNLTVTQTSANECESGNCGGTGGRPGGAGLVLRVVTRLLRAFRIRTANPLVGAGALL